MKARWITTYSFTLCIVSAAIILIYLDFKIAPGSMNQSFITDYKIYSDKASENRQPEPKDYFPKPIALKLQSRQRAAAQQSTTTTDSPPGYSSAEAEAETEPAPLSTAHIVAVVSYMRSGSSLTADILQHFQGTVYVFEPLHTVFRRAIEGKPLVYLDGRKILLKPENLTDEFITEELHKWFQCRYGDLDIFSLVDHFHKQFSRSMRILVQCWAMKHRTLKALKQCLPDAIKMCQNAKQRLFKFIRLPMRVIKKVFNLYPNLQVIHLIRDPRGSLTSQVKLKIFKWGDIATTSKARCDRISDDLNISVNLNQQDDKRVKILAYESLAENPINTAKRMYKYIGMPVMKYVTDYVRKLTLEGRRKSCLFCVVRSNSTKTAYSWRDVIRYEDMVAIDNSCPVVYSFMGYQRFNSQAELRNHSLDTRSTRNISIFT